MLVQIPQYLSICRVVVLAVRIACVCLPCDGAAAVQPLPLLPSLRSWLCPTLKHYHLKMKSVFITWHILIKERELCGEIMCVKHLVS